jgi:uncharacterized protein DUF5994
MAPPTSDLPPKTPHLRLEPTRSRHTFLDGCWWPGSTDPVVELPGLVLALDDLHGPVVRLLLSAAGWSRRPHGVEVAGRVVKLGYFSDQPANLLTASYSDGDSIDLLIMPSAVPGDDGRGGQEGCETGADQLSAVR